VAPVGLSRPIFAAFLPLETAWSGGFEGFSTSGERRVPGRAVADPGHPTPVALLVSLLLATLAVAVLRRWNARLPQARPTDRSLHDRPVVRVGGVAIWAGFIPVALYYSPVAAIATPVWLGAWLAVATVSLIDDGRGVHPVPRLAVHGAAALFVAVALWGPIPSALSVSWSLEVALVALALAWSANLFNFMDGNDGLAAMMALCGFAAYAIAAAMAGAPAQGYAALAAAIVPFLVVNLPPARAFMGDVGAVPLGFLAAVFGIAGWRTGVWPGWFPVLVFLPFMGDATATLARRAVRGERVWEAHRTHYYQRFHQLGAGHGGTLLLYCGLMAGGGASALAVLALNPDAGWYAVAVWTGIIAALFAGIDYHWGQKRRTP
jgi:UDP-N-acetylmuramyl pentapeptide phosphotransferase/UDP-N-acetylglucosamine-1-phosphate transferase